MDRSCPDIFYAINHQMFPSIDLVLLLRIEEQMQKAVCRKTPSPEMVLEVAENDALHIDFFKRVFVIHMKWAAACEETRFADEWAIPPQARLTPGPWYNAQKTFQQRLTWLCPFLQGLLGHPVLRDVSAVLSGSVIPLCILKHEVFIENKYHFLAYAGEVYKKCSIDIFVCQPHEVTYDWLYQKFLPALEEISQTKWQYREVKWEEDKDWVRNRKGTTYYFSTPASAMQIQLINMPLHTQNMAISHQHLPCVRASYDGTNVYVTASCLESWMSRFITSPALFGSHISQQRKSKTVFKYAMRGWGFNTRAVADLQLPQALIDWLREWPSKKPLPWYHPLYNPNVWPKAMPEERVRQLIECAEV